MSTELPTYVVIDGKLVSIEGTKEFNDMILEMTQAGITPDYYKEELTNGK